MKKRCITIPTGTKFGRIEVIGAPIKKITKSLKKQNTFRTFFPCRCECGTEIMITGSQLKSGRRTRCSKCAYRERPQSTERYSNEERLFNLNIVQRVKNTKGRIENFLTVEDFKSIISQNCYYCGEKPRIINYLNNNSIVKRGEILANGIDRLDSSKHYTIENCVSCCTKCNKAKNTLSVEEFRLHISKIYNYFDKKEKDGEEKTV